jgi:hypothetical protein
MEPGNLPAISGQTARRRMRVAHIAKLAACCDPVTSLVCVSSAKRLAILGNDRLCVAKAQIGMKRATSTF